MSHALYNIRELRTALLSAAELLKWERECLEDFHLYAHRFQASPGENVFEFVLRDALARRGLTREQLRAAK